MSKIDFSIADSIDWTADSPHLHLGPGFSPELHERARLRSLRKEEIRIARGFSGEGRWPYIVFSLAGFAMWLSFFPLCMMHLLNPVVACVLTAVLIPMQYIIGHEAMHGNLGRTGKHQSGLNELVGWVSLVPLVFPFTTARLTHAMHHSHCNDPLLDPDYCDDAPSAPTALIKTWYNRQPGGQNSTHHLMRVLKWIGSPEAIAAQRHMKFMQLSYLAILFALAWSGYAIEAALVWWLPRHLGLSYIRFTFSWLPHHPRGERKGRYANTRVFRSSLGGLLSMRFQYHIIHHLYPDILIHRHKRTFDAMRHVLEARGVDCSALPARGIQRAARA